MKLTIQTLQMEEFETVDDIYRVSKDETLNIIKRTSNGITFKTNLSLEEVLTKLHVEYDHPWLLVNNTVDGFIIIIDFNLDCHSYE